MGEVADALAVVPPFEWQGKEYEVGKCCYKVQAAYEVWLEKQAQDYVLRHEEDLPPAAFRMQLEGLRRDGAARVYSFGSDACWESMKHPPGQREMCYLLLRRKAPVTREMVAAVWEDDAARERLVALMLRQVLGPDRPDPTKAGGETSPPANE